MKDRQKRLLVTGILSVVYLLGLVIMFAGSVTSGASLWAASTIGGLVALWAFRREDEDRRDEEDAP